MGDRANIFMKDSDDRGVYFYTHWAGTELPKDLRDALARRDRWDDYQYLSRIVFCQMIAHDVSGSTGYGISPYCGDGSDRVLIVDVDNRTVAFSNKLWSFDEYANMSDEETSKVWE